jgi:collagenase-like PrtC family protease
VSTVELLAPAKDLETGIAAINCGADAVYVGAERFGAREARRVRGRPRLLEHRTG